MKTISNSYPKGDALRSHARGVMAPMAELVVETVEDPRSFESLKEEWNELLRASRSESLFLTWEWLWTWWKHLSDGRRLRLVTLRCGRELIAIAPLAVRPLRVRRLLPFRAVEFLGSGIIGSDYLDVIVRGGKEQDACHALADFLQHENLMLELTQLERRSCVAETLAADLWENSCLDALGRFSSPIMSCQAHGVFDVFARCRQDHWWQGSASVGPGGGPGG